VKGHQDSGQITILQREAWMNIEMDELAKQKVSPDEPQEQFDHCLYERWVCSFEGKYIITNLTSELQRHLNSPF